jgi:hypothetical protein
MCGMHLPFAALNEKCIKAISGVEIGLSLIFEEGPGYKAELSCNQRHVDKLQNVGIPLWPTQFPNPASVQSVISNAHLFRLLGGVVLCGVTVPEYSFMQGK